MKNFLIRVFLDENGICLHMTHANQKLLQNVNFYELCTFVNCFGKNAIKSSNINIILVSCHFDTYTESANESNSVEKLKNSQTTESFMINIQSTYTI